MPVNQSPSWFHVDFISLAARSAFTTPGHVRFSFLFRSHPKKCFGQPRPQTSLLSCVRNSPGRLLNVSRRMCATWRGVPCRPLASFSGINQGLRSPLRVKSANTQSHFRGSSLSPHQQQQQQQQQQRSFHVINSSGEHKRVHFSPRSSSPEFVQMSHLKWLRHISRDPGKSVMVLCNSTFNKVQPRRAACIENRPQEDGFGLGDERERERGEGEGGWEGEGRHFLKKRLVDEKGTVRRDVASKVVSN